MNTQKDILNSIELSNLLNKIELQVKNIETGDAHTEICNLTSFPFKSTVDNSDLRIEAMKELHGMLYKAFGLICQISLETNNNELLIVVGKSCTRMVDLLLSCQLKCTLFPFCVAVPSNTGIRVPIETNARSKSILISFPLPVTALFRV